MATIIPGIMIRIPEKENDKLVKIFKDALLKNLCPHCGKYVNGR